MYLVYPSDPRINAQLLSETSQTSLRLSYMGEEVTTAWLPAEIIEDLQQHGVTIVAVTVHMLAGRRELFGVPVTITKIVERRNRSKRERDVLKEIRIRITGDDFPELYQKKDIIAAGLAKFGVEFKFCVWTGMAGGQVLTKPKGIPAASVSGDRSHRPPARMIPRRDERKSPEAGSRPEVAIADISGAIHVKCPRCKHEWETKSKRVKINCPSCGKNVEVSKNLVRL